MTSERSRAYGRVMKTLEDVGPAKLQPREADVVRETADALFFSENLSSDEYALEMLSQVHDLVGRLVESERWLPETGGALIADLQACGPLLPVVS